MDQRQVPESGGISGIQEWVFNEIMDRMNTNIYVTDLETYEILFMNKTMKRAFGVENPEGRCCWDVLQSGMGGPCAFCPARELDSADPGRAVYVWEEHNTKNGRIYENYDSLMRWIDGRLVHFQHSVDITREKRLSREAEVDELTGVLNRRGGKELLQRLLDSGRRFSLCLLDANDLKGINDARGHQAGDAFLVSIVEAVRARLEPEDAMFRLSGDEFVVLLAEADRSEAVRRMTAAQDDMKTGAEGAGGFCFGIAEAGGDRERTAAGLLKEADSALYTAKRNLHIQRAEERLQFHPQVARDLDAFTYDEKLLYDALVRSTDDYLYVCNMKTGVFRYPQTMVDEFGLPGQVIENAAAVWGAKVHDQDKAAFLEANQDISDGRTESHCVEYRARNRRGEWLWMRCRGRLERDENGEPALFAGFITNLGKKNKIDQLTGLCNKLEFEEECRRLLEAGSLTCMLFGIDDLKRVNSLYDRQFGDEVIRIVSQRMQSYLPANAQMFRMDGDEFAVLIRGDSRATVRSFFHAVQEAFSTQQTYQGRKFYCTLSCGCVFAPRDGEEYQKLFKRAACTLEAAKRSGKDRIEFFTPEMLTHLERALELTELLRESVERNFDGFRLVYQPVFDLDRRLVGAEALCRWACPQYGEVPPGEFIGLLESSGLILRVGRWIYRQALQRCAAYLAVCPDFQISINLSCLQMEDASLYAFLTETAAELGVSPEHVVLELTESYLAANLSALSDLLKRLRGAGFRIAMDDFGTGYSSLSLLKRAPIDIVKLDCSFVQGIRESAFDQAFIRLTVELCHIAGIQACLEGVETAEEYAVVRPLHPDYFQGFWLGRPCGPEEFRARFLEKTGPV